MKSFLLLAILFVSVAYCQDLSIWADYIIVGAGSSGSALAGKILKTSSFAKVLLIEAGPSNDKASVKNFQLATANYNTDLDWAFTSVPQPELLNRTMGFNSGRGLGGGSSLNGMVYVRGNKKDFNQWSSLGASGWSFNDVLPFYKEIETVRSGDNGYHGTNGPIFPSSELTNNTYSQAIVRAANQIGIPFNRDYNGDSQIGIGYSFLNVKDYYRQDSFTSFVKKYETTGRLRVLTLTTVSKLVFVGKTVIGVQAVELNGKSNTYFARKEVILSAGALQTPKILMLSGIGPKQTLDKFSIPVKSDLSGVGQNLKDHCISIVVNQLAKPIPQPHPTVMDVNIFWNFSDSSPQARPDVQIQSYVISQWGEFRNAIAFGVFPLQPYSSGYITLASGNYLDAPIINPQFLKDPRDMELMRKGMQMLLNITSHLEFAGAAIVPQPGDSIDDVIRSQTSADYHPQGTCKMGRVTDPSVVVDSRCRVKGINRLRVVDMSIAPSPVSGNTNAAAYMVGTRAGAFIAQDFYSFAENDFDFLYREYSRNN